MGVVVHPHKNAYNLFCNEKFTFLRYYFNFLHYFYTLKGYKRKKNAPGDHIYNSKKIVQSRVVELLLNPQ